MINVNKAIFFRFLTPWCGKQKKHNKLKGIVEENKLKNNTKGHYNFSRTVYSLPDFIKYVLFHFNGTSARQRCTNFINPHLH